MAKPNSKAVLLTDPEAIEIVRDRAKRERRSFSNTLAIAVLESAGLLPASFRNQLHNKAADGFKQ